jgi:hypothetical protein
MEEFLEEHSYALHYTPLSGAIKWRVIDQTEEILYDAHAMARPENDTGLPLAELKRELASIQQKIEATDENENVIERTDALDRFSEERDWLMAEIAALLQQEDEQP